MVYRVLPDVRLDWPDVWVGAVTTSLLFGIGKFLIGLYLGRASIGSSYGAAGSLVVFLVWVYYSSLIMFFGAEITFVYAQHRRRRVRPTELAVVARVAALGNWTQRTRHRVGRTSSWQRERRFFGNDIASAEALAARAGGKSSTLSCDMRTPRRPAAVQAAPDAQGNGGGAATMFDTSARARALHSMGGKAGGGGGQGVTPTSGRGTRYGKDDFEHCIVERHLRRAFTCYFAHYHRARTHLALDKGAPDWRPTERPEVGTVVQIPDVGGLPHRYVRRAV
jgi:hypothetical protein